MFRSITRRLALLLPAALAVLPATATAATPATENALALQGTIYYASVAAPWAPDLLLDVMAVVPGPGAASPAAGGVDASHPWVGFEADHYGLATPGSDVCQSAANAPAAALPPPPGATAAAYTAYATCPGAGPYAGYAVEWFDDLHLGADTSGGPVPVGEWGYAVNTQGWGDPYRTSATTVFTPVAYTWTHVQVCGWDGVAYHCGGTANTVTGAGGQVDGTGFVWTTSLLIQNLTVAG